MYKDIYLSLIYILTDMVSDKKYEVRRLGKKVFFKLLNSKVIDKNDLKLKIQSMEENFNKD